MRQSPELRISFFIFYTKILNKGMIFLPMPFQGGIDGQKEKNGTTYREQ